VFFMFLDAVLLFSSKEYLKDEITMFYNNNTTFRKVNLLEEKKICSDTTGTN